MKISSKKQLKEILKEEENIYFINKNYYQKLLKILKLHPDYYSWKYTKLMRITSYYHYKRKQNLFYSFLYLYNCQRMNKLGRKLGIEAGENVFDKGIKIFHTQGIVINGNARVGKNCRLYGNNCIGNDGINNNCPKIGDNVRLCVGAKVIGDVTLANNITVAAGAIVTKSCLEEDVILGGIPAKIIRKNHKQERYLK